MLEGRVVKVILPALNEADAIGLVLDAIPTWVDERIVVDNGSTDATPEIARRAGATVLIEPRRGYGQACLTGIAALGACDVVVFLDADYSDYPEQMDRLVAPIVDDRADMVIGSRALGRRGEKSLTVPQRFGNALACSLMRVLWRARFTDLGPFRAIRASSLRILRMRDTNFGWTIEMQIKATQARLRCLERPVDYRRRIGRSKISGTLRGAFAAGSKILGTIGRYALRPPTSRPCARERLVIFSRYPLPGRAKTRLIPALGATQAAAVQRELTAQTLDVARRVADERGLDVEVRYTPGPARRMRRWLGGNVRYVPQGDGDLGEKMHRALADARDDGCERTAVIGTDCPALAPRHVAAALDALGDHDLVLGPSLDGGYWLIAMRRSLDVFADVAWSTEHVLDQTLDHARRIGASIHLLERLSDLDTPDDLAGTAWAERGGRPYLSVVIPAWNEQACIARAIDSARAEGAEVIVVDGGSDDRTVDLAREAGASVIEAPRGRGSQMNAGAAVARGEVLLFLHADTLLPAGYAQHVFDAMSDRHVIAGAFAFATDLAGSSMQALTWTVNRLRSKYLQLPYGDQALFLRRDTFTSLGGFPDVPVGEDLFFVRRVKAHGRIVTLGESVITSSRRWRAMGRARASLTNLAVLGGCYLGLRPEILARFRPGRMVRRGERGRESSKLPCESADSPV